MAKLTKKQKAFCDEYLINGGNATQAAIKAGYSKKTAKSIAKENLTKPYLKEYIDSKLKPIEKKREISANDALDKLVSIWQGELQTSFSKHIDNLDDGKVIKDMTYEYSPDLKSVIDALDLYLKYKSLLSQTQMDKMKVEIKLMQAKLERIQNVGNETTKDKLDLLLKTISGELDGD